MLAFGALLFAMMAAPAVSRADTLAETEREQQALFERIAPSVVVITTGGGMGSGFFVSRNGLVLTNAHVVGKSKEVDVVLLDGRKLRGVVVEKAASDIDLALVKLELEGTVPLRLGGGELRVGMWAAAIGHGMGGVWAFTTGMVSNIYPMGSTKPVFQTQIPLNPGTSGGPVFGRDGRVLGIVTSGIKESNSINFAIRAEVAVDNLQTLANSCESCLVVSAPAGVPVFIDGKMAGKGPRVVIVPEERTYTIFAIIKGNKREITVSVPAQMAVDLGN
ncbi:MAG: S1C family serine protease [Pseudomonadota bacterium]